MISVFKRELKALFTGYKGYGFVAAFSVLFCIISMLYHTVNLEEQYLPLMTESIGFANAEFSLIFLPVAFVLSAPLLTFSIFSDERQSGSYGFLRSLSLSVGDVVFGKYLAALTAFALPYGAIQLLLWFLGFYSGKDVLTVIVNILFYILACNAVLSLYFFISAACKRRIVALITELSVGAAFVALISTRYLVPPVLTKIFELLSVTGAYESSLYGIFDISALVLFLSLSALFLFLSYIFTKRDMQSSYSERIKLFGLKGNKALIAVVSAVCTVTVLLNVGVQLIPSGIMRLDVSADKMYTLSDPTKRYVSGLSEKVTLYVLDSDGSDMRYEYFLDELDSCTDKLDVKFVNREDVKELTDELGVTEYVTPYFLVMEGAKRNTYFDYSCMMEYSTDNTDLLYFLNMSGFSGTMNIIEYNKLCQTLNAGASSGGSNASSYATYLSYMLYDCERVFKGEENICKMLEYVNRETLPARYLLTGHGERVFSETMLGAFINSECMGQAISPAGSTYMGQYISASVGKYDCEYVELNTASGATVPDGTTSIIVFEPQNDISESEAGMLKEYLAGGGHITFITSDENLKMPNLMSVINAYGLYAEEGVVGEMVALEASGPEVDKEETDKTDKEKVYAPSEKVNAMVNDGHDAMSKYDAESIVPILTGANSIKYDREKCPNVPFGELLTTSEKCYLGDNTDALAARTVAAAAEDKATGARILWFTGAGSFAHEIVELDKVSEDEQILITSNCGSILNTIYWTPFTYESEVEEIDAKNFDRKLMVVTEGSYVFFTVAVIVAVVAVGILGFVICYKRKKA